VAQRLRQQPEFDHTLLVALTGYGSEDDRRRSLEAGFDLHLVKPPSIVSLRELLAHGKLAARKGE
jgi:CheY-like chemotaxis protein